MGNHHPKSFQAAEVVQLLVRTTHYVQQEYETRLNTLDLPFQLSGSRLRLLLTVWHEGQIRMNELASKLGVKARTITDLVDALEKDGLLIRLADPKDRRATLLKVTKAATPHIEEVKKIQNEISEKLIENLSKEQRDQLGELLYHLLRDKNFEFVC